MHQGRSLFAQLLEFAPHRAFQQCVARYHTGRAPRRLSYWDQFLVLVFAQLTYRESLRDIEAALGALPERLYHLGLRGGAVSRSTLADANERRDWRIFAAFAHGLIGEARALYATETLGADLAHTVYALDATNIDLCLTLYPWAHRQQGKSGVKLHTLLDLRGSIPTVVWITPGMVHDMRALDELVPEPGAIYVLDRGYMDFRRLYALHTAHAIFIVRAKQPLRARRRYSHPVDQATGVLSDHTLVLTRPQSAARYPAPLRRVRVTREGRPPLSLLTNDFALPATAIAALYRDRWRVELFFRWIKQHLRIKRFYGTSANAVAVQVWTALCTYLLVAIARKRLGLTRDLYTMLQVLSVSPFEKVPLAQALTLAREPRPDPDAANQLSFLNF
jgi:IS4 transposase